MSKSESKSEVSGAGEEQLSQSAASRTSLAYGATLGGSAFPPGHRPTPGGGEPMGMQLLKRALFPKRAQPVQIGRFNVLRPIGQGGMGMVYACYDEVLDRKVALKILKLEATRDRDTASARLVREGQALGRLSHPNVVTVHEVGRAGDDVYVAMEYVTGECLDAWAGVDSRTWEEVLKAFVQAGRGLQAAHRVSIIHRDFKPQNVMVNEDGLVKVLDFGLARASGEAVQPGWLESEPEDMRSSSGSELLRPLTVTGALVGTPAYMSPEQYLGQPVTAASDQFSFCVSLYECLYGALPFTASSLEALCADIIGGRVAPPPPRSPVPAWVYRALRRGMSADPAGRFASMKELLAVLDRRRSSRGRWLATTTAVVLAGVGGFIVADVSDPRAEICPDAQLELEGVWDEAESAAFGELVRATGSARADEVIDTVVPHLDRYADEWAQVRDESCLAHAEGLQSDTIFDQGMACLDQRRAGLDALVGVFQTADAERIEGLVLAAMALPPIGPCGDTTALLADVRPPESPKLGARVQTHREDLARVEVLHWTGDHEQGMELIHRITADEAAMAYLPLAAEVDLKRGFLEWEGLDTDSAERSLERAMLTALTVGHTAVAAQASSRLAYLRGVVLSQQARAKVDLPLVEALNLRVQEDVDLYAEYLNNAGMIMSVTGELDEAIGLLESAAALRTQHRRDQTPLALGTLSNLGQLAEKRGRIEASERALRRAFVSAKELLGETSLSTMSLERLLAQMLHLRGRTRESSERLQNILRRSEALGAENLMLDAHRELGACALEDGDTSRARQHLEAALRLAPSSLSDRFEILCLLMLASARADDEPSTMSYVDRARKSLGSDDNSGHDRSMLDYHEGRALTALGRPDDALVPLERLRSSLSPEFIAAEPSIAPRLSLALGETYRLAGDLDAAEVALDRALVGFGANWTILRADTVHELGLVALSRERGEEAAQFLSRAVSIYTTTAEPDYRSLAKARFALARALTPAGGAAPPSAVDHAKAALQAFRAKGQAEDAEAVEAWLTLDRE